MATGGVIVSLVVPWWTWENATAGAGQSLSAGPFDSNAGQIKESAATTSGFLVLVALLFLAAAAVLLMIGSTVRTTSPKLGAAGPWLGLAGSLLMIASLVFAVLRYPDEVSTARLDVDFWDEIGSLSVSAGLGWWMGAAGALMGIGASVAGMLTTKAPRGLAT